MDYKFTIDKDIAAMYSKNNCRKCHGRGWYEYQPGTVPISKRSNIPPLQLNYCSCARNNAKKYK